MPLKLVEYPANEELARVFCCFSPFLCLFVLLGGMQVPANEDIAASCTKHKKVLFLNLQETHLQVLHLQELATLFLAYVRAR